MYLKYFELKELLKKEIMTQLEMDGDKTDDEIAGLIDDMIYQRSKQQYMSTATKLTLKQELFNAIRRLDVLQELLDDETITEIMVNGAGKIFFERMGTLYQWHKTFESSEKLEDVIQQIVSRANRQVNTSSPIVDTSLDDGSRVNVVLKPVALNGPILTIRKFPKDPITMEDLLDGESISEEARKFLQKMVEAGYNIFISGGTGTGKTTILNVLANYIPRDERVITVEDTAELQIKSIENLVRLEVRNANSDGTGEVTMRDLVKSALRMRPNRIIIGEVRGAEAIDLLQAMNTGHNGSLSTGHSNSVEDMISRLETMVMMGSDIPLKAIRKQIASSIDIFIQLGRLRDKSRRIIEICEVDGMEGDEIKLNPLFRFVEDEDSYLEGCLREVGTYNGVPRVQGKLLATGNPLIHRQKLIDAAITL